MKRLALLLLIFSLVAATYAQEWVSVDKSAPMKIQKHLVSSSEEEIIVDVKLNGFFKESVTTLKGKQVIISGDDMVSMLVAGAPDLSLYSMPLIIGDKAEMEVNVIKSKYVDFEDVEVAPSKGNFSRKINPDDVPFTYSDVYQHDAFYPAQQAVLENPYVIRDFRAQNMLVYPYAYNPVTKILRVFTELTLSVKKVSDNGVNQKVSLRNNKSLSPEFDALYKRRFINYQNNHRTSLIDEGEMLIICVDEYLDALQTLVDWKNISGRPTKIVASSVTGKDEKMKQYIADYYKNNPELIYVLLVGEHKDLPAHMTGDGRSDNYYGMLEGDDSYEEVFVGRLSVKDVEDAENQVAKIIYYERDIDESASWLSEGAGIAAKEGTGHFSEYDYEHMDFIRDTLLNYTYTGVTQHYDKVNSPTVDDLVKRFNDGVGIINYCNHGTATSWTVTGFNNDNIHQLTNDYMLPFIWSVACDNGAFNNEECFAEAWMRAMNPETGAPTGAIGGMFSTILQPWRPPMYGQDEMVAILTEWRDGYKHTLGGASCNGNMFILDVITDETAEETHDTWILFGDPSMMLRTKAPEKMNVTTTSTSLLVGATSISVNAEAEFGIATLSMDNKMIASSYIKNGVAELTFPQLTEAGNAKIIVMGYNKVTEIIDINVMPATGAYIVIEDFDINQDDAQVDCNEYIELDLNVKNIGVGEADNVTLELSTTSEYVKFVDNTETITSAAVGESINLKKAFKFLVTADVPNDTKINLVMTCKDANGSYKTSFSIDAFAPVFALNEISLLPNKIVNPGESATLKLVFDNVGNSTAHDVLVELFSSSSDIEFENSTMTVDEVLAGESFFVTADFTVSSSVTDKSIYEIIYSAGSNHNVLKSVYELVIGSVSEDFETADFTTYDWNLQVNNPWIIDNSNAYEGVYCAKSAIIGHNQYSSLKIEIEALTAGELKFYRKVSSEAESDYFAIIVDSRERERWSGNVDWDVYSYTLKAGKHTIEWRYVKDEEISEGNDRASIDMVSFPPAVLVSPFSAVANLEAELQDNGDLTLTWNASEEAEEYIVRRDGEIVSTQTETSYYEEFEEGIRTYSVVARKAELYSEPVFVIVDPNKKSPENINDYTSENISLCPNPTSGMIYVDSDKSFDAVIYNYQSQIVMKKEDNFRQIDLSNLKSGVYFLEIRENDNVKIEKIIINK